MATCRECLHYGLCEYSIIIDREIKCKDFKRKHGEWNSDMIGFCNVCMECGAIVERTAIKNNSGKLNFCPNCGVDNRKEQK